MQTAVLMLLLGGCLCVVHGGEQWSTPDVVSTDESLVGRIQNLERELAQLKNSPRMAFFAVFYTDTEEGNYGPFNIPTTIKYKNVLTNIGNGYNAATGVFTALVKGLYVFHFTLFSSYSPPPNAVAALKRNGVKLAYVFDKSTTDTNDSSTRVGVVTLEAGDSVYVELQAESIFYDYKGDHNSFSGFLLYPL